ncbi:hypothetical protein HKD37_18G050017 [Glycine soja]
MTIGTCLLMKMFQKWQWKTPLNDCPMVTLINEAFHPSKVVTKAIILSIRQQFAKSWPTWGAIPKDHQELFFQHFKSKEFGRSTYIDEVFQQTHLQKDTGQFVDDRSTQTHVRPLSCMLFYFLNVYYIYEIMNVYESSVLVLTT